MSFRGSEYVSSLQRALTSELNEDIDLSTIELNEAGFETLAEPSNIGQDTELEVALSDKRHTAAEAKGLDDHEVI